MKIIKSSLSLCFSLFFFITLLSGCGGGDSTKMTTVSLDTNKSLDVSLGEAGNLAFPAGSLPAGAEVKVEKLDELLRPVLIDALVPVGDAWKIEVTEQPLIPVEISLPVPEGEEPGGLALVRVESSGKITLLQTRVEDNRLIALTPGFSSFIIARRQGDLLNFSPKIIGPDVLPVGTKGQYAEAGPQWLFGLNRRWDKFEYYIPKIENSLEVSEGDVASSLVTFTGYEAGATVLTVNYADPLTGINITANKRITVVDEFLLDEVGSEAKLDLGIYGPVIVNEDSSFTVKAAILNTNVDRATSWSCYVTNYSGQTASCGECSNSCEKIYASNEILTSGSYLSNPEKIRVEAFGENNRFGFVEMPIMVLPTDQFSVIEFDVVLPNSRVWSQFDPGISVTATAKVGDTPPPYTYEWFLNDKSVEKRVSNSDVDQFNITIDQPGGYRVDVSVTDALGNNGQFRNNFFIQPTKEEPVQVFFRNTPFDDMKIGQALSVEVFVRGGALVNYIQKEDYGYIVDWGDGSDIVFGTIAADKVQDGGAEFVSHKYLSSGNREIKIKAFVDVNGFIKQLFETQGAGEALARLNDLKEKIPDNMILSEATATVTVIDEVADAQPSNKICPANIVANGRDGTTKALTLSSFNAVFSQKVARCEYGDGLVYIDLRYDSTGNDTGCQRAHLSTDEVYLTFSRAYSTKRGISLRIGSSGYLLDYRSKLENHDEVRTTMLQQAVREEVGSVCEVSTLPRVSISATDPVAFEDGKKTAVFRISRDGDLTKTLTVNMTQEGSATVGRDFSIDESVRVVIPAGEEAVLVTVTPVDDLKIEGDETVKLILTPNLYYLLGGDSEAVISITDRGGATLVLSEVVFSKSEMNNDLCGDTVTCIDLSNYAQSRRSDEYYFISNGTAEYRLDVERDSPTKTLSEYRVTFSFDEPPVNISSGSTISLDIEGTAQGFIEESAIRRNFSYFIERPNRDRIYPDGLVSLYSRDLPEYIPAAGPNASVRGTFKGMITDNATIEILIPEEVADGLTIVGWLNRGLYVRWVYKMEGSLTP